MVLCRKGKNMFVTTISLWLAASALHLYARRGVLAKGLAAEILLTYALVFLVGFSGLMAGLGHIFAGPQIAAKIGWAAGSPFQFEVGLHDFAWGVLGVLCLRASFGFRLATGLGWSVFLLGAGINHAREAALESNHAPYNTGMILPDLLTPALILTLLFLTWRWRAKNNF